VFRILDKQQAVTVLNNTTDLLRAALFEDSNDMTSVIAVFAFKLYFVSSAIGNAVSLV